MELRERSRRHLPTLTWSLAVAVMLLTPADYVPDLEGPSWLDKALHAILFAIHFGLLTRSLARRPGGAELGTAAWVSGLYALLLEMAQVWVPGRRWDAWDLVADAVGIAAAALLIARRRATLRRTP
jgi:VanZ family protein